MKDTASYSKKWLVYIISFFILSAAVLLISEFFHERKFRIQALNIRLDNYATIVHGYVEKYDMVETGDFSMMDSLVDIISNRYVRFSIIDSAGKVLFDSQVLNPGKMENHLGRPEIRQAISKQYGTDIRISETTKNKYYYFARYHNNYFIRVSDVYESARIFIQPSRIFIIILILILLGASLGLLISTNKFGKSISTLKDFTLKAASNKPIDDQLIFPENELGNIGQEIIGIYQNLNKTKEALLSERTKLIRHLNLLDEGIAIFSKDKKVITSNNNFIRLINYISDTRIFNADDFFHVKDFKSIFSFIDRSVNDKKEPEDDIPPAYEITISKGGRYFSVKCIVFQDKSFEVFVDDISRPTKRKMLKQQLTDNIAHELKTPVSSIKGFLETILEGRPNPEKTMEFLRRAYSQACRLADLVHDISMLTKIEEAGNLYKIEDVNIRELIDDIIGELKPAFEEKNIDLEVSVPENLTLKGNAGLIYSIFRNLFDNSIDHGGNDITVKLDHYLADEKYFYFSYSDNGTGVPETDLSRLFERFYRVEKGRDRKKGGTGLGLAIVKNAIQFHKGDISVRNRKGGGLEFLFTLSKES
ncbi:MAG TPA: ATP-binding protein [Bacteroidales bacterium]|jgi:two-component system OmpR family sensor kinase/two-component system phosphate regulon sensor histidine kinase PhoR|nr:ATP-binding protein [Bacteroidales bacterium]